MRAHTVQQLAAGADDHDIRRPEALLASIVDWSHAFLRHRVLGDLGDARIRPHRALEVAVDQIVIVLIGNRSEAAEPTGVGFKLADWHAVRAARTVRIVFANRIAASIAGLE